MCIVGSCDIIRIMIKDPKKTTDVFFSHYTLLRYKKGEVIVRAEDPPPGVFYLKRGFVRKCLVSEKGELLMLHVFKSGSFFPMTWVINNTPNKYYFEALSPAEITRAPKEDVLKFLSSHPEVLLHFTSRLLHGVSGMLERFEQLVLDSAYIKTVLLLLYYARCFGEKEHEIVVLHVSLTHREIAAWIGTTRETASLQIEALKKKNLISYNGRQIRIQSVSRLEQELLKKEFH
jgi:CRP/FNR family transcriptional regulator, cyclic AMP receptor protein